MVIHRASIELRKGYRSAAGHGNAMTTPYEEERNHPIISPILSGYLAPLPYVSTGNLWSTPAYLERLKSFTTMKQQVMRAMGPVVKVPRVAGAGFTPTPQSAKIEGMIDEHSPLYTLPALTYQPPRSQPRESRQAAIRSGISSPSHLFPANNVSRPPSSQYNSSVLGNIGASGLENSATVSVRKHNALSSNLTSSSPNIKHCGSANNTSPSPPIPKYNYLTTSEMPSSSTLREHYQQPTVASNSRAVTRTAPEASSQHSASQGNMQETTAHDTGRSPDRYITAEFDDSDISDAYVTLIPLGDGETLIRRMPHGYNQRLAADAAEISRLQAENHALKLACRQNAKERDESQEIARQLRLELDQEKFANMKMEHDLAALNSKDEEKRESRIYGGGKWWDKAHGSGSNRLPFLSSPTKVIWD